MQFSELACLCINRTSTDTVWLKPRLLRPGTHYSHVTFYVLFSNPSLFLPMSWLSYADLYNLVTWWHVKRSFGAIFNKHFLHFSKITGNNVEEHSTRTSRLTKCVRQQKFKRRAGMRADQSSSQITWRKQSDRSVSVRQNSMLNIPTALVTSRDVKIVCTRPK
jgi:hypothetical protein